MWRRTKGALVSWITILVVVVLSDGYLIAPWLARRHPTVRLALDVSGYVAFAALVALVAYVVGRRVWRPLALRRDIAEHTARRRPAELRSPAPTTALDTSPPNGATSNGHGRPTGAQDEPVPEV